MNLLAPLGLLALITLPLIVVIHMRHTTPTRKSFPALRFWLASRPERTEQTRFRRPPITFALICQLAIAAMLGMALARPVTSRAIDALGFDLRTEPRHLIILLDGSASMAATDTHTGRTRFEEARELAMEELANLREGDVGTVLVLGTRTTTIGGTDAAALTALRQRLQDLRAPGGRTDLNAALSLTRDLLLPNLHDQVMLITDGAVTADAGTVRRLAAPIELRLVGGAASGEIASNVAIVDMAARANAGSSGPARVFARIVNFGPSEMIVPVTMRADDFMLEPETATLAANGGAAELNWRLPPGATNVEVVIPHVDALSADDVASLAFDAGDADSIALKIVLISDVPGDIARALSAIQGSDVPQLSSDRLSDAVTSEQYDLIVFEKIIPSPELLTKIQTPMLFVNPPAGGLFETTGAMLTPTVRRLRAQDPLLSEVDLAGVTFGETPVYQLGPGWLEIAGADDGPLLFRGEIDHKPALVIAFDPALSNLPRRPAFPILIKNAVNELGPTPLPPAISVGEPLRYRPRPNTVTVRVILPDGTPTDLAVDVSDNSAIATNGGSQSPAIRLREVVFADTGNPGKYVVIELDEADQEISRGALIVNAGNERESNLRPNPDLPDVLRTPRDSAIEASTGSNLTDFWPVLAAIALALLAVEWVAALRPSRVRPRVKRGRSTILTHVP